MTGARIADGNVVLTEANHDRPAGTVVATIEIKDGICTLRGFDKDGIPQTAERLQIDHLGAKYHHGEESHYVLIVDNWKFYPAFLPAYLLKWIKGVVR